MEFRRQVYRAGLLALAVAGWLCAAPEAPALAASFAPGEVLTLGNKFIVIGVNSTDDGTGRFALETTGGDPAKPDDDGKPLVYGRPRPWTSYTTVRLDGANYVFGGKTEKRAGGEVPYGQMSRVPETQDGSIVTATTFGSVEVTQRLSLAKSSTTGLMDTMRVTYTVENRDSAVHEVGLRIMLDTLLGDNDGAPFRAGEDAITTDTQFEGQDLPEFWQAFDSLQSPSVTAQGVLNEKSVTRPDRVVISNWGSLADGAWEVDYQAGRDFTRSGEFELDSALALYWDQRPLLPGETRVYATEYGLGGITVAPGLLALGVTAPAQVAANRAGEATFPVIAYVESRGDGPAREAKVTLGLPKGLELAGGYATTRDLGDLEPGRSVQVMWQVVARGAAGRTLSFSVQSEAFGVDPNRVQRNVTIMSPPSLSLEVEALPSIGIVGDRLSPERIPIVAKVKNSGSSDAYLVKVTSELLSGLDFVEFEKTSKFIGTLAAGESRTVTWIVKPVPGGATEGRVRVLAEGSNVGAVAADKQGAVPPLAPRIGFVGPDGSIKVGRIFRVDVVAVNIDSLDGVKFDLRVDPSILSVLGVSRGNLFVGADGQLLPFGLGGIDNSTGRITGFAAKSQASGAASGHVLTVHLLAKGAGASQVQLENVAVYSRNQTQVIGVESLRLEVTAP